MFGKFALAAFAAVASAEEVSNSCSTFKEYVAANRYDCGDDFETCRSTEHCDTHACDGSSDEEMAISRGGYLYELNCGGLADGDAWRKICELERVLHRDDKNATTACHGNGDARCTATLELLDTLTYEWQISCDSGAIFDKVDGEARDWN